MAWYGAFVKFWDLHFGEQFEGWRFWDAIGWDLNVGMLEYSRAIVVRFSGDTRAIIGRLWDLRDPHVPSGRWAEEPYQGGVGVALPLGVVKKKKKKKKKKPQKKKEPGQDNLGGRQVGMWGVCK
jgi:hypothetical protein